MEDKTNGVGKKNDWYGCFDKVKMGFVKLVCVIWIGLFAKSRQKGLKS